MKILSIDTSSSICSVAILEDYNVIKELCVDDDKTHSEKLMPMIKDILFQTHLTLSDIDLLSCNKGPGSFTGIRIGISTIKGLATPANKCVCGINALRSLAYSIKTKGIICSLIDAKNDNVYFGLFNLQNTKYLVLEKYEFANINDIIKILEKYNDITFIGNGALIHKNLLKSNCNNPKFAIGNKNNASSINIGKAAFDKFQINDIQSEDNLFPLYLRKSQAERSYKEGIKNESSY